MLKMPSFLTASAAAAIAVVLAALGGTAMSAQDKYAARVPDGLALSDFKGYENWQVVAVSQTETSLKVIVANPKMIEAYRAGVPGNGKKFPDGSKIAKIEWSPKKDAEAPFPAMVPDTLKGVGFIEKSGKRFADSGGWGYAQFKYDTASDALKPDGSGTKCGFACHSKVAEKDYMFTAYPKR